MSINLQPQLENEHTKLRPLQEQDFDALYPIASDPKIWEQHPEKDRWRKDIFQTFFDRAMKSGGAFVILDKHTGNVIGSSRFYEYDEQKNSICIGFTFYAVAYWGTGINPAVKELMLDYAFSFVSTVYFHVGANNLRSQTAVERLGAVKVAEQEAPD
ncbi:MAG: GNAT family N-acetyltransferase, partial [Pedobacter sp.]|uniref:GNAT family N-acetyltransferase n=1 Tax=Pedobacter sp. TaxID=1411316 RepID=UPI003390A4C5